MNTEQLTLIAVRERAFRYHLSAYLYVCMSVCMYVYNTITFENLNVESSFWPVGTY